jgi:glycosyltransferase involved in cell wall biosynthesis
VSDVSINSVIGGAERVLYEQTTGLAKRGHNISIITRSLPGQNSQYQSVKGVNEYRYKFQKGNVLSVFASVSHKSRRLFEKLNHEIHFDCINFHQPLSAVSLLHSNAISTIPKIYTCHSLSFQEYISRNAPPLDFISRWKQFVIAQGYKMVENIALQKSDQIVALSQFTKQNISRMHKIRKEKIQIIPGGVDLWRFRPARNKNEIRWRLKLPPNRIVLFTVRNLVQRMGLENLIIAINQLLKQRLDIHLVIGGTGPLQPKLISMIREFGIDDYVKLLGFIGDDELPFYYQMADMFILPTLELEGFGLVTIEAMASGCPVLGTPVGGTKEIIGSFDSSFMFEGTDAHLMAELIREKYHLIKNCPEDWRKKANDCRKFVERHYSWDNNIDSLEALVMQTIQN